MISLFLGLGTANLLLLSMTFGLGLFATDGGHEPTGIFAYHITIGIASGLMTALTHTAVYTYLMATSKWLHAAADKAALPPEQYVAPAYARKRRAMVVCMGAIGVTVMAMFAGAASDPAAPIAWWPKGGHLILAVLALAVNAIAMAKQFTLIREQGTLMDRALAILNAFTTPPTQAKHA